jgi:pSer/pThr/pTyr-binding forkhead associated (FHA) protein
VIVAKLVLTNDGKVLDQHFLDKDSITVGSHQDNDVVVPDAALSQEHLRIISIGEDHIAENLHGDGGTLINGQSLSRQILQNRDVITLGAHQLTYVNTRMAADIDLERTMLIQVIPREQGAAEGAPLFAVPAMQPPKVRLAEGYVTIEACESGRNQVGERIFLERVVTTFGTPGEQLVLFTRRPQGYFLYHVEGRKQPHVNGQPLVANAAPLRNGDRIVAAGYQFTFSSK